MDIVSQPGLTGKRLQFLHYYPHQRGFTLAVPADERHFLPTFDFNLGIAEHHLLRIPHREVRSLENHVSGALGGRKTESHPGLIGLIHLYPVQFFQRLDAGLNLVALGGFVAEAVDERFRFLNHPLLVLIGGGLLGHPLFAQQHVLAVGHFIVVDMPQQDFHRTGSDVIQKLSVVRDQ